MSQTFALHVLPKSIPPDKVPNMKTPLQAFGNGEPFRVMERSASALFRVSIKGDDSRSRSTDFIESF